MPNAPMPLNFAPLRLCARIFIAGFRFMGLFFFFPYGAIFVVGSLHGPGPSAPIPRTRTQ